MKTLANMALMAVAGAAAAASAQPLGTATYSLRFSNGLNTITLGPGQSTTVSVFVSFNPGVGAWVGSAPPLQGQVLGLNNGGFSITGTSVGGGTGNFSVPAVIPGPPVQHPALQAPYNFLPGIATNQGTSSGASHNGVIWGHGFFQFYPPAANPGFVWQATFTATSATGSIQLAFTGLPVTQIDVSSGPIGSMTIPWVADYASDPGVGGTIFVPAPAGLALAGLGGFVALRRLRSRLVG